MSEVYLTHWSSGCRPRGDVWCWRCVGRGSANPYRTETVHMRNTSSVLKSLQLSFSSTSSSWRPAVRGWNQSSIMDPYIFGSAEVRGLQRTWFKAIYFSLSDLFFYKLCNRVRTSVRSGRVWSGRCLINIYAGMVGPIPLIRNSPWFGSLLN